MISRRTAHLIAQLISRRFSEPIGIYGYRTIDADGFYDFLFVNGYEPYLMNKVRQFRPATDYRESQQLLMELHTGESLVHATRNWNWEERKKLGNRLLRDLAEDYLQQNFHSDYANNQEDEHRVKLISSLELDGYLYSNGKLLFSEAAVLDTEGEEGILERLISQLALPDQRTPAHHLALAAEHYAAGRWDDSISNSRKVLESVLAQVADTHSTRIKGAPLPPAKLQRPVEVREYLRDENLVEEKEKKALAEVYGLLSSAGGHPYIAQKDQARLMRHLALTFTQFALLRLQGALQSAGIPV